MGNAHLGWKRFLTKEIYEVLGGFPNYTRPALNRAGSRSSEKYSMCLVGGRDSL